VTGGKAASVLTDLSASGPFVFFRKRNPFGTYRKRRNPQKKRRQFESGDKGKGCMEGEKLVQIQNGEEGREGNGLWPQRTIGPLEANFAEIPRGPPSPPSSKKWKGGVRKN